MKSSGAYQLGIDFSRKGSLPGKVVMILGNWLLQGIWYMDRSERAFTAAVELILFGISFGLLKALTGTDLLLALVASSVVTHTLNWILNGHFWALMLETRFSRMRTGKDRLLAYANKMSERLLDRRCFTSMYVYGSMSRGTPGETSDLDIRLVLAPGFTNRIRGCFATSVERARAFLKHFPLDVHAVDSSDRLQGMRADETPIALFQHEGTA